MFNFFKRNKGDNNHKLTTKNYVPFTFITDCFLLSKGHFGNDEDYSFDDLDENEKIVLVSLFNLWHIRLNLIISKIFENKVTNELIKTNPPLLIKSIYEVCFFDYPQIMARLKYKGFSNKNTNGAILDTLKWTFNKYKIWDNGYYSNYKELEENKITYYLNFYSYENDLTKLEQGDVDRLYFKIIQNPCSALILPKFDVNVNIIRSKLQFVSDLVIGQSIFLKEIINPIDKQKINITPKIQGYHPYPKPQTNNATNKIDLEDFIYKQTKIVFDNKTSENDQYLNSFLKTEISLNERKLVKEEIKYLMISLTQFFIYKYEAVEKKHLKLTDAIEVEKFQKQMSLGIERGFLVPHQNLDLNFETFKDRYGKYTFYLGEFEYKDFRKSFVVSFTSQLTGGFENNVYNINAPDNELINVGNWIYSVWTELLEDALRSKEFAY